MDMPACCSPCHCTKEGWSRERLEQMLPSQEQGNEGDFPAESRLLLSQAEYFWLSSIFQLFRILQPLWKIDPGPKYCDGSDFHSKHVQGYFVLFVLVLQVFSPLMQSEQSGLRVRLKDIVKLLISFTALDPSQSNIGHTSPTNPHTLAPPHPSWRQYCQLKEVCFSEFVLEIQNLQVGNLNTPALSSINCGDFCFAM